MPSNTNDASFLDKYKNLNSWNKWNVSGTKQNTWNSQPTLSSSHGNDTILRQAGPAQVYLPSGYVTEPGTTTQITTEITHHPAQCVPTHQHHEYRINEDPNPVRMVRHSEPVTQRQNVRVRYLEPPALPTPAPIIIKERQLTPPPPAPPIYIRQHLPAPPTPPPLVIRERPPCPPEMPQPTVIEKIIPAPTPPPRQVIVERIPAPERPREVIYEKWLPYKPLPERQVIVERGKTWEKQPAPKNVIIEYERPNVIVDKRVYDEGVIRADPCTYNSYSSCGNEEVRVVDHITDLPVPNAAGQPPPVQWTSSRPVTSYARECEKPKQQISASGSSVIAKGPVTYGAGPWNTTYRSSYTSRGFAK